MNKNLLLSTLLLLFLSNIFINAQAQFVTNGDFENWPTGCPFNTPPDNWLNFSSSLGPDQAGTCAGTVTSYSGDSHMNLVWANNGLREGAEQVLATLVSGNTYRLSFYAINNQGLYADPGSVILDVYVEGFLVYSTPELSNGGSWTEYTYNFTPTSTSIGFKVEQGLSGTSGSVGIDLVTVTDLTSIEEETSGLQVELYPNPAQDELFLSLPAGTRNTTVEIIDTWGKKVLHTSPGIRGQQATLDVADLASGVYLVRIQVENEWVTHRILIQ